MTVVDRVRDLAAPVVAGAGVELYDVEHNGGVLRIMVDAAGGVDIGVIQRISRELSRILDEADPVPGRYTLEVSSPGLERPLRVLDHYRSAVDEKVTVKLVPGVEGDRRLTGTLRSADADGFELDIDGTIRRIAYADVSKARTVFEWGPGPKPGSRRATKSEPHAHSSTEATTP